MKTTIGCVVGLFVILLSSSAFGQSGKRTMITLAPGEEQCIAVTSGESADPSRAAHPECDGVTDPVARARIDGFNDRLNKMRGRFDVLSERVSVVEISVVAAQQTADDALTKANEVSGQVAAQGDIVNEVVLDHAVLVKRTDAVVAHDKAQDERIDEVNERLAGVEERTSNLERSTNQITLRGGYMGLTGVHGDTYVGPVAYVGLALGINPELRLAFEGGLTADGKNLGTSFKTAIVADVGDKTKINLGLSATGLGLTETSDSQAIFVGIEGGFSALIGPVIVEFNAMPAAINFATRHQPVFGLGGNLNIKYLF